MITQHEFEAHLDAKLMEKNPAMAEANRVSIPFSGSFNGNLDIIAASSERKVCAHCGQEKLLIEFPPIGREYSQEMPLFFQVHRHCWECLYQDCLNKMKFRLTSYNNNPVRSHAYELKKKLFNFGWISLGNCFCGKQATEYHHPRRNRPHEGICLCEEHHSELEAWIDEVCQETGYIPEHHVRRYFIKIGRSGRYYDVRPEYAEELNGPKPLTIREKEDREHDRRRRDMYKLPRVPKLEKRLQTWKFQ